jgi:hypothetical protein
MMPSTVVQLVCSISLLELVSESNKIVWSNILHSLGFRTTKYCGISYDFNIDSKWFEHIPT